MIHGWEKDEGWTCIYIGKERDLGRSGGVRMAVMRARSALPDPSGSPAHLRIGFLRWNRGKGRAKEHKLKERIDLDGNHKKQVDFLIRNSLQIDHVL